MMHLLLFLSAVSFTNGFTTQRIALMQPARPSRLVVYEIDVDAVTSAVSVDQIRKESMSIPSPIPSPPPPPQAEIDLKLELTKSPEVEVSPSLPSPPETTATLPPPPVPTETTVVASPTWSGDTPETSVSGDIPLVAVAGGLLAAFAVATFAMRERVDEEATASGSTENKVTTTTPDVTPASTTSVDVSVPYDAAALLAYDEWRNANGKGAYDNSKFQKFKVNYEKITSANMGAKKVARDTGSSPELQSLPPNADE